MKFVKCDKCGKVRKISLVDSDYVVKDEDDESIAYDDISEEYIAETRFDLCKDCYRKLKDIKAKIEEDFVEEINRRRNNYYVETNNN